VSTYRVYPHQDNKCGFKKKKKKKKGNLPNSFQFVMALERKLRNTTNMTQAAAKLPPRATGQFQLMSVGKL
jgi:hypothetical protein